MSLPITLPGNPTSALQAAPKQYVDAALAAKADLMSGTIPASELGTGTAGASTCLLGNGTWGACSGTGSMVYPEAGIASSNGSAWGASLAAPSSTIMGVSDTQTVSNKDFTSLTNVFSGIAGRTVTAGGTDSITSTDANRFVIYNDGATNVTATVADAGGSGLNHYPTIPVVNQGTGTITLNRTSASTINGLATVQISAQSSCTLSSIDNANWLLRCAPLLNAVGQISAAAMLYPTVGVPNSTGAGWGTSYGVGTAAGNLLALDCEREPDAAGKFDGEWTVVGDGAVADWVGTGDFGDDGGRGGIELARDFERRQLLYFGELGDTGANRDPSAGKFDDAEYEWDRGGGDGDELGESGPRASER